MNPGDPMPVVFLSYAGSARAEALEISAALEQRGIQVKMDATFRVGESIIVNIGEAADCDATIALITSDYLDRRYTEIEVSTAIANADASFLPVVLEGQQPAPTTPRGKSLWRVLRARTYMRLRLTEGNFDRLANQVRDRAQPDARPREVLAGDEDVEEVVIALLYDWEDGNVIDDVADQCAARGVTLAHISSAGVPLPDRLPDSLQIGVLWTPAAQFSLDISEAISAAAAANRQVIYLTQADGPPLPSSAKVLELGPLGTARKRPVVPSDVLWSRDKAQLRVRVDESVKLNSGVPFHLIGDKFCASRASASAAAEAYRLAVHQVPAFDEIRLQAVLGYAAACRFRGDWKQAADLLAKEPLPDTDVPYTPAALAVAAERLSLDFELGFINDIATRAGAILASALAAGEWPLIIAAHRQLGMIREERGEYRAARDHLDRACHYAEDLLDAPSLAERITTNEARRALRADCLRELAAVEWRDGEPELAREHLDLARDVLGSVRSNPAADYLLSVITYERARVQYSMDNDYESARNALQESYHALQRYDNPVRLATVLESLTQLEMDFLRGDDAKIGQHRATLEKVRRVRVVRGHDYMIARTTRALGDLEFALGNYREASEHYVEAWQEFNRLGKNPETATTLRYLSRCLSRLGDSNGAIGHLDEALAHLREPDHHATLAEIRSERARLRHRPLRRDQLTNDIEMTEVGEFAVHEWIASGLLSSATVDAAHVVVGVGDDGAVLRPGADDDLIVTTDSVPPSMLTDDSPQTASFAARFAVVATLADVIAMGGEPTAVLLNLHLRRTTSASWAHEFLERAAEESARYGAVVVGGDLRERGHKALTATGVGRIQKGRAITRHGASPGDLIALTLSSSPGHEFSGLGTRWALDLARHLSGDEASLISPLADRNATFTDLGMPHRIMRSISDARLATSAIDTSDGLLACAELIGTASGVGIEFFPDEIARLIDPNVSRLARSLGIAPVMFAFSAGYDWEVLLTVPSSREEELRTLAASQVKSTYQNVAVIGRVVRRESWATEGVHLAVRNEQPVLLPFFTGEKFLPQPYLLRARGWLEFAKESTRRIPHEVSELDSA
jgi:thiamine-monophosphate kinase